KRIAAFVGTGNNGGDAVGALRHLANWGAVVHALVVGTRERLRETTNLQIARLLVTTDESRSGRVTNVGSRWSNFEKYVEADLLIDGLLGYNARGAPRDEVAVAIGAAARTSCPILAVDIPSGIDPDTGDAYGVAIDATLTVTLARPIAVVGAKESFNWSGYMQGTLEKGTTFHSISADWIVPEVQQRNAGEAEYSSSWIGIGGGCVDAGCSVSDATLIQAGIGHD